MNHLLSPELTARYEPLDILGRGAFATVVKARSRRSGELVAIKHFQHPSGQRHSFFRELQLTLQLRHPNIVNCINLYSADNNSSDLILEFADSGNLRTQIIEGQPLTIQQAIPIVLHIANGLVHAHNEGIIHRDLKPENILIFTHQPETIYKIADFGIAKFVGKAGKTLTNVGSPVYMAPEQFYERYDFKTDIYSLGIIFYELLHGEVPFQGSHANIFKGHLEGTAVISGHIPTSANHLLQEMLAKPPEDRPQAIAVRTALQTLALAYDLTISLPVPNETQRHSAVPQSGEFVFADFFDEPKQLDADPLAASSSSEPVTAPKTTGPPDMQDKSADHFFDFDDQEVDLPKAPQPAPAAMPASATPSLQAEGLFDEGFAEAEPALDGMAFRLSGELSEAPIHCGHMLITPQWTRAVDTTSLHLVNLRDDAPLLVVTQKGVHELNAQAGKGMTLYQGEVQSMGSPGQSILPLLSGQNVIVLHREQTQPHIWAAQGLADQICFAPNVQGAAAVVEKTLYYHDHQGELLWSGQFSNDPSAVYLDFEPSGDLIVTGCHPDDYGVYFYSRDGRVLTQYWLPGPIVAAARCHFDVGIWVVITTDNGAQVLRIARHGTIVRPRSIEHPLQRLVGTARWLCGVDETGSLYVLDPATGHMAPIPLAGTPLDYCPGTHEGFLYILESRSEVLRYISVFAIEQETAELKSSAPRTS